MPPADESAASAANPPFVSGKDWRTTQPTFRTARLTLVPLTDEHLELEVKVDSDAEVMRYLTGRGPYGAEVERAHQRRRKRDCAIVGGILVGSAVLPVLSGVVASRAGGPQALTVVTFPSAGEPLLAPALTAMTAAAGLAAFMADSQVPWHVDAPAGQVTDPAWRTKPSWYMITTEDQMIPPTARRGMSQRIGATVTDVAASHSVYLSQPRATTDLIKQAAQGAAAY